MQYSQQAPDESKNAPRSSSESAIAIVSEIHITREAIASVLALVKNAPTVQCSFSLDDLFAFFDRHVDEPPIAAATARAHDLSGVPSADRLGLLEGLAADQAVTIRLTASRSSVEDARADNVGRTRHMRANDDMQSLCIYAVVDTHLIPRLPDEGARMDGRQSLTPREQQVLTLIADGLSNRDIATRLAIELSTVKNHVHNILKRLRAHGRREAARFVPAASPYPDQSPAGKVKSC